MAVMADTVSPRVPWRTLGIAWALMIVAAAIYANLKHIPLGLALPVAIAFAVELPFYVMAGAPPDWLRKPAVLAVTCVLPYLIYSIPAGLFGLPAFVLLSVIAIVLSYWYAGLPRHGLLDLLYVALLAAILLTKLFDRIYLSAIPKVELAVLGHVMLIRTAAVAIIGMRGGTGAQYTFVPRLSEWASGVKWFALMLPPVLLALWATGLWTPREHPNYWALIPQFLGILWVVALSEEFFFRGMLQSWMESWTGNRIGGLVVTSLMFGFAHLWFRRQFPNWQFAIVAAIFGLFCGLAWREKRSVPASMVTHALGATLYRVFFQ
jgi:membrane protease YdiL (CAAX protease family)